MKKQILTALIAAVLAVPAVAQNLAVVNGKPIPMARADVLAKLLANSGRPVPPDRMDQFKKNLINREVWVQEAQKQGLDASEEFKTVMELTREDLLIRDLFSNFQKNNPVTDVEIKAEYDKVIAAYSGTKEYRARHILVEKESEAKAIIAQLKKGAKFDAIAKKQSKDPGSGAQGGDLNWATPGSYVPEFSEAMVKLSKGQITDTPVKSQFGYHVIRLDDVRETQAPKLEEVKDKIAEQVSGQKLMKYQQDLRDKAKVE